MKPLFYCLLLITSFTTRQCMAQSPEKTIILVRHAEKDTTDRADPVLSPAGMKRAAGLQQRLQHWSPGAMYTTPYKRTRQTLQPWAASAGITVQTYDPRNLAGFATQLLNDTNRVIVVAGHSNTTPALVNLLIGSNSYPALDESVYNKIYIVEVNKQGEKTAKIVDY